MSNENGRRGVLEPNLAYDSYRLSANDRCWWCGDVATTEEHRIKASTLRRVGRSDDGITVPGNVFKKSSDYEGPLRTIKRGAQVRWGKNMCANCNNSKSQPFDRAYDGFEVFLVTNFEMIAGWTHLDWQAVYGEEWQVGARNLARYFAKQLGCMLATYDLTIPADIRRFLDGADRCPSVRFKLAINPRIVTFMRAEGAGTDMSTYVGLSDAQGYSSGNTFSGIDYIFYIGYLNFLAEWRKGSASSSWFERSTCELPRFAA